MKISNKKRNNHSYRKYKPEEIKTLLQEKIDNKLSVIDFCKLHQISDATYYKWRKKFPEKLNTNPVFISTELQLPETPTNHMPFAEIFMPGQIIIRLFTDVPVGFLKTLCAL